MTSCTMSGSLQRVNTHLACRNILPEKCDGSDGIVDRSNSDHIIIFGKDLRYQYKTMPNSNGPVFSAY
jgi:hypothetical protein